MVALLKGFQCNQKKPLNFVLPSSPVKIVYVLGNVERSKLNEQNCIEISIPCMWLRWDVKGERVIYPAVGAQY